MDGTEERDVINLKSIAKHLWARKKLFIKVMVITLVVASVLIVSVPRYYGCSVRLAPELGNTMSGTSLSSLASTFLGTSANMTTDAIYPALYPDLMASNDFIVTLFPIRVRDIEGEIDTTYYDYMRFCQKKPWWEYPLGAVRRTVMRVLKPKKKFPAGVGEGNGNPAFRLSEEDTEIVQNIKRSIGCTIDKKTEVITISVTDQDPLICATMADSIKARLQTFITNYRTNKARIDLDYYKELTESAKREYDEARMKYARYADANMDLRLERQKGMLEDLSNDLQIKFSNYTVFNNQLQMAIAKVQERTPAFTIVQGATVPIRPAGPKRTMFVLGMLFLAFIVTSIYVLKDEFLKQLK